MKAFADQRKIKPLFRRHAPVVAVDQGGRVCCLQRAQIRQILDSPRPQFKLTIGAPDDVYEQEADRVADAVMRMQDPQVGERQVQRMCVEELQRQRVEEPQEEELQRQPVAESEEEIEDLEQQVETLQTKSNPGGGRVVDSGVASQINSLRGGGQPLPESARQFFEPRFGQDFSAVRVHENDRAAETARAVNARAFTLKGDIVFGKGEYSPGSVEGKQLIAHELTHVVQQSKEESSPETATIRRDPPDTTEEKWERDYYYKTEKKAKRRVAKLKTTWKDAKYKPVTVKGQVRWQVEKLGPEKAPSRPTPGWSPDGSTYETKPDAEARMKALVAEDKWKEFRVQQIEVSGKKRFRVEMRGKLTLGTSTFALTFDDGPHTAPLGGGKNRTENVLNTLEAEGIKGKGAFFVQTHAPYRGSTKIGAALIKRMFNDGYTVGIHTGGPKDHESHPAAQKAGRLKTELGSGKKHIKGITGKDPSLVRAPYGATSKAVREVYKKLKLRHLHWDIDGDPGGSHPLSKLKKLFDTGLSILTRGAKGTFHTTTGVSSRIVILYHDIRQGTSANIGAMIRYIRSKVKNAKFDKP